MILRCLNCNKPLKPSQIEEHKYHCRKCNKIHSTEELQEHFNILHKKRYNKPVCSCGMKMKFNTEIGKWECPIKKELEKKIRYEQ